MAVSSRTPLAQGTRPLNRSSEVLSDGADELLVGRVIDCLDTDDLVGEIVVKFSKMLLEPALIVAELEDSALLQTLEEDGHGVFVAPTVIAEVRARYGVERVGATHELATDSMS